MLSPSTMHFFVRLPGNRPHVNFASDGPGMPSQTNQCHQASIWLATPPRKWLPQHQQTPRLTQSIILQLEAPSLPLRLLPASPL